MRTSIITLGLLASFPGLTGCEKEIELDYDDTNARIVIEGSVTQGSGPHEVRIKRSVDFTETNVFPAVEDAVVTIVDDQGEDETLVHVGGGVYRTSGTLIGASGHTYALSVQVDGNTITASSTMPNPVDLDTLEVDNFGAFGGDNNVIIPRYTDPAGMENYYRLRAFTNGEAWGTIFSRDDKVSDGQVNGQPIFNNDEAPQTGDTVTVDLLCIDAAVFLYWFSLEQNTGGGPNASAAPADPTTNLSGNVLGYFSAHVQSRRSVVIP
jgi:Domain of unknown function (DUF4249)